MSTSSVNARETYPPGWYVIADSDEIPRGKPVKLRRFGIDIVVFRRDDGSIAALDDRCRHRGASLALGKVHDNCVACPFHGFEFDGDGECKRLPVLGDGAKIPKAMNTRAFVVREQDRWVWLWVTEDFFEQNPSRPALDTLPPPPRFAHLETGRHRTNTIAREWDASFIRIIENQLDPFHLPFVHQSTIGRNMQPAMTVNHHETDDVITAWPGEARTDPHDGFYIELRWANLWVNNLSNKFAIAAAFCPIDATHTRTYLRTYQAIFTVPVLGWVFDQLLQLSNRKIFSQDQAVVVSQPQEPAIATDEVLVKADGAIIAYRKMFARKLRGERSSAHDRAAE